MSSLTNQAQMNTLNIVDLQLLAHKEEWQRGVEHGTGDHVILFAAEGKVSVQTSTFNGLLHEGDVLMLPAGEGEHVIMPASEPAKLYVVFFASIHLDRSEGKWRAETAAPLWQGKLRLRLAAVIRHRFDELYRLLKEQGRYSISLQICWLELVQAIQKSIQESEQNLNQLLREIIAHMDDHPEDHFQVEELARCSGVTPTIFYQQFKTHTSLSPLQYITKNRMEKARRLLATGEMEIRDVAGEVGYQDVYYFNRVFKKMIGIPPYRYQKAISRKIAVLNPSLYGNLLALGVPHEGMIPFWNRIEQKRCYQKIEAYDRELDWLTRMQPELIIGTKQAEPLYDRLLAIAPTTLLTFKPYSWRDHFIQLAELLDIKQAALNWLTYYELKAANAHERIYQELGEQTVLAALEHETGVRVYGAQRRKIGHLLYRDLQLNPPADITSFAFKDIGSLAELNDFKADHILLFRQTPLVSTKRGVIKGKVHYAGIHPWFDYSACGHEQAIKQSILCFSGQSS